MTKLPDSVTVCRIPYRVVETDNEYSYEVAPDKQEIRITQNAATPRKRQYLMWEIAHTLLEAAGMPDKDLERYYKQVGSVLNWFVIDNGMEWVKGKKPLPTTLWINGIPYTLTYGKFDELIKESLGGRVTYDTLQIQLLEDMKKDIMLYVIVHECTHALLFEAAASNYPSREPFVEALAWQILYFLQDNELSKLKPEGD